MVWSIESTGKGVYTLTSLHACELLAWRSKHNMIRLSRRGSQFDKTYSPLQQQQEGSYSLRTFG